MRNLYQEPATDTPIRWSGRKGFICEACLEKSWNAPIVPVCFTQAKTKATKPRHNVATGKETMRMSWLKSEYRQKFERKMGWISSVKIDKN